jgi:catechol 2,3-dioxygenase-like lactoylglutathione lyase family enzyme
MTAHFILYVSDQSRSTAFYAAALGFAPALDVPGMTEFRLGPDCVLGLMPEAGARRLLGDVVPDPGSAPGVPRCELYLVVADPRAGLDRAVAAGARALSPVAPRDWGHEAGYCADPDGHVLAFARAM